MLFKNNKEKSLRARKKNEGIGYSWITIKPGETAELPEHYGDALGLDGVEKQKEPVNDKGQTVEGYMKEKQESEESDQEDEENPEENQEVDVENGFVEKLQEVKGIGKKTAEDIINTYSTEEELRKAVQEDEYLPFQDDVAAKLRENFQ